MSQECLASGMDFFLSKPIRRPALKHVLKTYCPTILEEDVESTTPPNVLPATVDVSKANGKAAQPAHPTTTTAPFTIVTRDPTAGRHPDNSPNISPSTSPLS